MRWTPLLLLAVACTHNQPPPAPLAVPVENAEGPANLPDAGVDGGVPHAPDGGAPRRDGGVRHAELMDPASEARSSSGETSLDCEAAACEVDRPVLGRLAQR